MPVILSGFAYAALFVYVPNRRVAWRDALIGGFIAAILAEIFKHAFGEFVSRGTTGSIYGAFAVLPLVSDLDLLVLVRRAVWCCHHCHVAAPARNAVR